MPPGICFERVTFRYPEADRDVFTGLDLAVPPGVTSLVGQNGTGKSTLLLLASGRLLPTAGRVLVRGTDTRDLLDEEQRQALVSFVYQNMEFDSEEPIGDLLAFVRDHGLHAGASPDPVPGLVEAFGLRPVMGRRTREVSKGELQRTILAFSLLWGSPVMAMDEPVFAMEDRHKAAAMEYLCRRARAGDFTLLYSVHELDLSERYSDSLLLFPKEGPPRIGPTAEMFTREAIEKAYEAPMFMLKRREELYRRYLSELTKVRGETGPREE